MCVCVCTSFQININCLFGITQYIYTIRIGSIGKQTEVMHSTKSRYILTKLAAKKCTQGAHIFAGEKGIGVFAGKPRQKNFQKRHGRDDSEWRALSHGL